MNQNPALAQIREKERASHTQLYSEHALYQDGSWLKKPVKSVLELIPLFRSYTQLRVLDLGCGVGRNCIAIARHFSGIPCSVDCVDILELAIQKLEENANKYGVAQSIHGIVEPIDAYSIPPNQYDWILAVSALEHMDSKTSFLKKLEEIRDGIRKNGIVSLVINSDVKEFDKSTGSAMPVQFELNFSTAELRDLLEQAFRGWQVLKSTVKTQQYDIPRENGICVLRTSVVTFAAKK